ncbi:MAG TPA: LLM class F420-dependent oxidoreductase [Acidimicrobiales bacterium]|jgi:F420-dependent oxidoreductase-like protein|nr:LLM class F420-dependent oxidoreductase [Acidimicrobiales bacterium]
MRIGIFGGETGQGAGGMDELVKAVRETVDQGFASYWLPQIFGVDALTALAVIGREVPDIELGTSVIPTYPRHPMMLAGQALTTQNASNGRLALGIGLSHQIVVESMWGLSFDKPVRHMREYLSILRPLLYGEPVSFRGESFSTSGALTVEAAYGAPPILVAALGTQMLNVTGRLADGTITWMTGPSTLSEHTVPTLRSAAAAAGRPEAVRVVAGLPVCVTDDEAAGRERAANVFAIYGQLPSYRAMLDREGAHGPADVALVGDEATVRSGVERLAEAGATDFLAAEFGATDSERSRTRDLLRSLV